MKLKFKHQQFQEDAVQVVVDCFKGQVNDVSRFTLDRGIRKKVENVHVDELMSAAVTDIGFKNKEITLNEGEVFRNIKAVQQVNGLKVSEKLSGKYNLTIEMETGTGKTYTYIRTMFELNRQYGWSKFIIVVPSIAIREGVFKSFELTDDHFMLDYGKKARPFIYNSKQLHNIENFASDAGINVMIINSQAFAARGKDARRIYMELDEFQTRRPIDVLAQTNPIMIIDEPQSVEGAKTKDALQVFNPLFTLRYSATHREEYNKIYRLDALDAYNQKLVKKINVKGISVKGTSGMEGYLYLEGIDVSTKKAPVARLEFEKKTGSGLKRDSKIFKETDDLYQYSGELEEYKGYRIAQINGQNNTVSFTNGVILSAGEVKGDTSEPNFRRIQIRETIRSHFEKERRLFSHGIKVLSLFFIDSVEKYRQYDAAGNELNGLYGTIFEEEYQDQMNEHITLFGDDPYVQYLKRITPERTHQGYFSVDKKTKHFVDSKVSARESDSDDVDAYDLIMRDKEKLLGFDEPTRFIFSHSALKEGWDNPNVFQICTLKHSDSVIRKRQEVGRGLRLCVNQDGDRIDSSVPGIDVHDINVLTVIASESYESFAKDLQSEIAASLSDRPRKADEQFFLNKLVADETGQTLIISSHLAKVLNKEFYKRDYIDADDNLLPAYFEAVESGTLILPKDFSGFEKSVIELVKTIYVEGRTDGVEDARKGNVELKPNANYGKKEFQELWKRINQKSAYTVSFDSSELVEKCVIALDAKLIVPEVQYKVTQGQLGEMASRDQLKQGNAMTVLDTKTEAVEQSVVSNVKYDLVGKMIDDTRLTRKTIVEILTRIKPSTFVMFQKNPEEFIIRSAKLINEQKATTIIERITYDLVNETFDTAEIFTKNSLKGKSGESAFPVEKHIYDYIVTDSKGERKFAKELDASKEVCVYAKLPRGFFIPTPVGTYNPDWAIAFVEGSVKHIYFVAETKGSMVSLDFRGIESAKIDCARKHFALLSTENVTYDVVDNYDRLMDIVNGRATQ